MERLQINREINVSPSWPEAPPDDPRSKSAAAAGPRNGAEGTYEAHKFNENDTASLVARHPIIAAYWGFSA